ncbi:MAG: hypothetical protein KAH20_03335 [Methylococcales bacterium]|nr:hypothetical protein [Methylococcales bacterium]
MRPFSRTILFILLLASLAACNKNITSDTMPTHITVGETYYTQFVIRHEKNTHKTTNYRIGAAIAVNTPVVLTDITRKVIDVEVKATSQKLRIKNVKKHTGDDTLGAFDKLFSKNKVNLNNFTPLERKHIQAGTVAKGMRKTAVTTTIGFPPISKTINLDADKWIYWSHRFNTFHVNFKNGEVISVID